MDFLGRYLFVILLFTLMAGYNRYSDDGSLIGSVSQANSVSYAEFTFLSDVPDVDDLDLERRSEGIDFERYHLIVSYRPSGAESGKNYMIAAESSGDDLSDLQVFETGSLSGVIVDKSGQPLSDIGVKLVGINSTSYTDFEGRFHLEDVPPGKHYVELSRDGFISNRLAIVSKETTDMESVGFLQF